MKDHFVWWSITKFLENIIWIDWKKTSCCHDLWLASQKNLVFESLKKWKSRKSTFISIQWLILKMMSQ